jgi:hypothetical protein
MARHSEPSKPIGRDKNIREFDFDEPFNCEPARLFVILGDTSQWPTKGEPRMLSRKEPTRVQVSFDDATRATIVFERGQEPGTALLKVHHDLCLDGNQVRSWKTYWRNHMQALKNRVEL